MNLAPYRNSDTPIEILIRRRGLWARLLRRVWVFLMRMWLGEAPLAVRSKSRREYVRVMNNYTLKYENERLTREHERVAKEQEGRWSREDD